MAELSADTFFCRVWPISVNFLFVFFVLKNKIKQKFAKLMESTLWERFKDRGIVDIGKTNSIYVECSLTK